MPPPQPEHAQDGDAQENSLPLDHSHILLTSFNSFLTVAIHNILYYRNIYPQSTFLSTRAYNLPVHQNRHPKVCSWIRDAVDAVAIQLATGHVDRIAIVIHSPYTTPSTTTTTTTRTPNPKDPLSFPPSSTHDPQPPSPPPGGTVLERWLISTSNFPRWPDTLDSDLATTSSSTGPNNNHPSKAMSTFSRILARDARSEEARERHLAPDPHNARFSWPDLDEQLRGALRRMASTAEAMGPLPVEGCGFTVAVELAEEGRAPIGHPQPWIPSEPNLQPKSRARSAAGEDLGGVKTRPIRSVEAGPLFFECWVEESQAKEVLSRIAAAEGQQSSGEGQQSSG
ncbi:hypothetical protein VTJ49DRAFT_4509 [Mycothermus thermophilus]|uniref:HORMA domain-containing protein n=1 Tax=Humicola insolens TaxID=85995 RepID=A0ABR3V630_HUMIN